MVGSQRLERSPAWWEPADKPDSVRPAGVGGRAVIYLGRPLPAGSRDLPGARRAASSHLLGLAPDGVYLAAGVTAGAGALLPHPFTLTRASPGGLLSVALSTRHRVWALPSVLPCGVRTFLDPPPHRCGLQTATAWPTPVPG